VVLDVFPRHSGKPVLRHQNRDITGQHKAIPVDDRIDRYSRAKPRRAPYHPARQYTTTAASGHKQIVGIYVAFCDDSVDSRVQIEKVISRISMMDEVAELLAVACASSRICIDHNIAAGRHHLLLGVESPTVIGKGSSVNLQYQRLLFRAIKVRRFYDPALDLSLIERGFIPELLDLTQFLLSQDIVVDRGDHP